MQTDFDVAIVGAGPVGLALAGFLALRWGKDLAHRIAVFDAKPEPEQNLKQQHDVRILALSEASRLRLSVLGFPDSATPIESIHISRQGGLGVVRLNAKAHQLPALGYTVAYDELTQMLSQTVAKMGVTLHWSTPVSNVAQLNQDDGHAQAVIHTPKGNFTCLLQVDAEGGLFNPQYERQTVQVQKFVDYQQSALVGNAMLQLDSKLTGQGNIAFERFTSDGPLAFLPIEALNPLVAQEKKGLRFYTWVWCAKPEMIAKTLAQQDMASAVLAKQFEQSMSGRFQVSSVKVLGQYPLGLIQHDLLYGKRRVRIGNAAQKLHPVAGQGFNLGLRDALQLATLLSPQGLVKDNDSQKLLKQYAQCRTLDRTILTEVTHMLATGFIKPVLQSALGAALACMSTSTATKSLLVQTLLYGFMSPQTQLNFENASRFEVHS